MSDFDVTDNYELEWEDDLSAELVMNSGITIRVELGALPDWMVASRVTATRSNGDVIDDYLQIWPDDATARRHVARHTRDIINREEPLGENVNWSNSELIYLLEEQGRIIFCPICMGDDRVLCHACFGTAYIRTEHFDEWITVVDDIE